MTVLIDDIKVIYKTARADAEIQEFLDIALMIVNEDVRPRSSLSEERYDKITLYLAVHFLSVSDSAGAGTGSGGELKSSRLGDASESYNTPSVTAFGYESTRWGQMAIVLDTSGALAAQQANKGLKAQLRVVGGSHG